MPLNEETGAYYIIYIRKIGPRRDLYILKIYLFISFLHTQKHMAQGYVNRVLSEFKSQ